MPGALDYAPFMSTVVPIPATISEQADDLARRLHKTLSQVVTEALSEYLARHGSSTGSERRGADFETSPEGEDGFAIRQRREAGDALIQAALASPLDSRQFRLALRELEDGRARSDRF